MRRTVATLLLGALFASAFAAGRGGAAAGAHADRPADNPAGMPAGAAAGIPADTLRSADCYLEGIRLKCIDGDTTQAERLFDEAVRRDSTYAPALFELARIRIDGGRRGASEYARRAWRQDTTDKWYLRIYGQALLSDGRFGEALGVYRRLVRTDGNDPDNYRLLAALYEQDGQPYAAVVTLDSADVRFGRIPYLGAMKRRLLLSTRQYDRALEEVRRAIGEAPHDPAHRCALGDIYAARGDDSLAVAAYGEALKIDSTDIRALMSLSDFYGERRNYRAQLGTSQRLFANERVPLEAKIRLFERYTADVRFYREYWPQIDALAATLAIRHPDEGRATELYARHLTASGELEQALALYKILTRRERPDAESFRHVIDIESYMQHPDSVDRYVDRALELFPEMPEFHLSKGHVLLYMKQPAKAAKAYRRSLRYAAGDSLRGVVWGLIGDALHQQVEAADSTYEARAVETPGGIPRRAMKRAYEAYDRSLELHPDNAATLNNYAYFLSLEGRDLERALKMAERVTELTEGNNATYLDTHAWVLFRMGRTAEAKRLQQQAVVIDGQRSPGLLVHMGDILEALGERTMARFWWRKAAENGYDAEAIARRFERNRAAEAAQKND